jgi:integrase
MPRYTPRNQKKDLTDALVAALPAHDGKARSREYEVRDTRTTGLMVSVSKTGKKAWRFRYTVDGRKRGTTLGTFPALRVATAREECWRLRGLLEKGVDPVEQQREDAAERLTFGEYMLETYLPHVEATVPRSHANRVRHYENTLKHPWGRLRLREIAASHVQTVLHKFHKGRSASTVNRLRSTLHHAFNHAYRLGLVEANPVSRVPRLREDPHRERYLSDDELTKFLAALKDCRPVPANVLELLLATGMRCGEAMALRWEYIDWERRMLVLPRSKSGKKRPVALNDVALEVLDRQREGVAGTSPYVFPARSGKGHYRSVRGTFERVCKELGIEGLRIHDLRHSAASIMIQNGSTLAEVMVQLGHSTPAMTNRYAHFSDQSRHRASARLSEHLKKVRAS